MSGRKPLSFANVIASLSLFVALSGTAVAAVALDRDSVGSREIRDGAVRSSELLDGGVRIADLSSGAKGALLGDLRTSEDEFVRFVATCDGNDLTDCPDHSVLGLADGGPARNWHVEAKFQVGFATGETDATNRCGLVQIRSSGPEVVLDEAQIAGDIEQTIALSAVVKKPAGNPVISLRCTEQPGTDGVPGSQDVGHTVFVRMTALEVGKVREK